MKKAVHTAVPYKVDRPKSRLAPVLTLQERRALAEAMLLDVLDAVRGARLGPVSLLSTSRRGLPPLPESVRVEADPRPLTVAVNRFITRLGSRWPAGGVLVVVPDLPLAGPEHLRGAARRPEPVVLAPGRRGGTSLLLTRDPRFRVDYHRSSFRKHLVAARDLGLRASVVDSFFLAQDVDEPDDLLEVLLHGHGRSARLLRGLGFEVRIRGLHPVLSRATRKLLPTGREGFREEASPLAERAGEQTATKVLKREKNKSKAAWIPSASGSLLTTFSSSPKRRSSAHAGRSTPGRASPAPSP